MLPLEASKVLIVEGVADDPAMAARAGRLRRGIRAPEVRTVDDAALAEVVREDLARRPRHGMDAHVRPVVILNRFRFDDPEAEQKRRIAAYPELNAFKFNGYGGFEWRPSGEPEWRERLGLVCQPAWQLHTVVGCHFRCAYCDFGHFINLMLNMEEFVGRLDGDLERCPDQTLFQYDNFTDTVCFEPEYGGARLLVEYFARKAGKALELYVGKSDHVGWLLDLDHRGHTVCCWSVAGRTQSLRFERGAAPMDERIEAIGRCQDAGYPVRVRFSPILPVAGWREENREMMERLFARAHPDVITIETIRFLDYDAMAELFDFALLDADFVAAMKGARGQPYTQGCEVPDAWRARVYEFFFDELTRLAPDVPVAFCREKRTLWLKFADRFAPHGQQPDRYMCNCGPYSAPATV